MRERWGRQRADGTWTERNPRVRAANNNPEDLLEGVSGSGPPLSGSGQRGEERFAGVVESHSEGGRQSKSSDGIWRGLCVCQYVSGGGRACAHGVMSR